MYCDIAFRHLSLFFFVSQSLKCVCFFFKQKTAYEMRISDWSSDVCSSDLEPLTDYSKYKMLCEQVLTEERTPGFATLIIRPATVCGYEIGRASCRARVCQYV